MNEKRRSDYKPVVDVDEYDECKAIQKRCRREVKNFYKTVNGE